MTRLGAMLLILLAGCSGAPAAPPLEAPVEEAQHAGNTTATALSHHGNTTAAGIQYLVRFSDLSDITFNVPRGASWLNVTLQHEGTGSMTFELVDPQERRHHLDGTVTEDVDVVLYTVHVVAGVNLEDEATIRVAEPAGGQWQAIVWAQGAAVGSYTLSVETT